MPVPPEVPHPSRLSPDHPAHAAVVAAHRAALAAGAPTYRDPVTGLDVLTSAALVARGSCCDSGCRHCPFLGGG